VKYHCTFEEFTSFKAKKFYNKYIPLHNPEDSADATWPQLQGNCPSNNKVNKR